MDITQAGVGKRATFTRTQACTHACSVQHCCAVPLRWLQGLTLVTQFMRTALATASQVEAGAPPLDERVVVLDTATHVLEVRGHPRAGGARPTMCQLCVATQVMHAGRPRAACTSMRGRARPFFLCLWLRSRI